jgi:hypothetical protein
MFFGLLFFLFFLWHWWRWALSLIGVVSREGVLWHARDFSGLFGSLDSYKFLLNFPPTEGHQIPKKLSNQPQTKAPSKPTPIHFSSSLTFLKNHPYQFLFLIFFNFIRIRHKKKNYRKIFKTIFYFSKIKFLVGFVTLTKLNVEKLKFSNIWNCQENC